MLLGALYHHEALNGTGYPQGLTKKDIPYEGQIIRVADEYDAIVSKRQYKSHIGISDALKIIIENTYPSKELKKANALSQIALNTHLGKNNPAIVKILFKVVIEDIEYEIYSTQKYIDDISVELERFKDILKYKEKMEKAKKEKDKNYYLEGIKVLLKGHETLDNYMSIYEQYKNAYEIRTNIINNLYNEIKIIKKLKV